MTRSPSRLAMTLLRQASLPRERATSGAARSVAPAFHSCTSPGDARCDTTARKPIALPSWSNLRLVAGCAVGALMWVGIIYAIRSLT